MNKKSNPEQQIAALQGYYQFHARIYDLTRWSFLFSRTEILQHIPFAPQADFTLIEVGCGTGKNLATIAKKFPHAKLIGYDISTDMLQVAEKKLSHIHPNQINLIARPYSLTEATRNCDCVLFSYTLSMINPQYREAITQAQRDLKTGGVILVVDFFSGVPFYKKFMHLNHVRMDAHLLPALEELFTSEYLAIRRAYLGIWKYFLFVGRKL